MKRLRYVLLFALTMWTATAFSAAPQAGKSYMIMNVKTQCALSNLGDGSNDARLYVDQPDATATEQVWTLVHNATVQQENVFQIYNPYYASALDFALQAGSGPLQWTLATGTGQSLSNQLVTFLPVSGTSDTYRLRASDGMTYLAADDALRLVLTRDAAAEGTLFRLVEVEMADIGARVWEDETFFEENKERAHAPYMPYATTEKLRADAARCERPWLEPTGADYLWLGGKWKISYADSWSRRADETDFWGADANVNAWQEVDVPGCLEMQGYGEPMYVNVEYPFADAPPRIRMKSGLNNGVASLRRDFTLPAGWKADRCVFLHFDGIYGAAFVWINGQYVGYTQGANNVSEFDVSSQVREGTNSVAVQIVRFSDGSYLEGQDMWHMTGIHRDVYLYSTPRTFISDYKITADIKLPTTFTGISVMKGKAAATVTLTVCNRDKLPAGKHIAVSIISPKGVEMGKVETNVAFNAGDSLRTVSIEMPEIASAELWSAETPSLYTFEIVQADGGREEMAFQTKYGFRTIDITEKYLKVNGRRVYLKGVNAQDTHPLTGRTVGTETLEQDIKLMKQANINCLRTSHYPRQTKMMAMLDYYGMYVVDEADMECHKNWDDHKSLSGDGFITGTESWRAAIVDRSVRMVMRDRNNACVVFWSLGNESGAGDNISAAYDAVKELDDRPVHYEGATRAWAYGSDIWSEMYPYINDVKNGAGGNYFAQPYFACEYAHAMGNAVGNLKEYWDEIMGSACGVGGCIWDWVDQSIYDAKDIKNGTLEVNGFPKYISGYDKPGPHQGNFVNNGIIGADRAWTAKLAEVKAVYQNVTLESRTGQRVRFQNGFSFRNLRDFQLNWELLEDGKPIEQASEGMPSCAPGAVVSMEIPYATTISQEHEYILNMYVCSKDETSWADAGYVVASFQEPLNSVARGALAEKSTDGELLTLTEGSVITVGNSKTEIRFSKDGISSWTYGDMPLMLPDAGPELYDYRYVENDEPYGNAESYDMDALVGNKTLTYKLADDRRSCSFTIKAEGEKAPYLFSYTFYADGTLDLQASYVPRVSDLKRLGFAMCFPAGMENVTYYGRGPWSNFVDRRDGAPLGIYSSTVSELFEPFSRPQTTGTHGDLRWLTLTRADGKGLRIETAGDVEFSLLHYDDKDMKAVRHNWELTPADFVYAHFDVMQKGVGNGSCGPGTLGKYCIPSGNVMTHSLRLFPIDEFATGVQIPEAAGNIRVRHDASTLWAEGALESGATVEVYNLGGVRMAAKKASEACSKMTLNIGGLQHAAYIVVVRNKAEKTIYKIRL